MKTSSSNPWLRGAAAALLVGTAGGWSGPTVLVLAVAAGAVSFDLGRRSDAERAAVADGVIGDWYGPAMQLAFLAVLGAGAWDNRPPEVAWRPPGLVGVAGALVIFAGVRLRQRAADALGRHFTVALSVLADHELVASGPYRRLRHPNYAGLLLVALGTAMMVWSVRAVGVTLAIWLPLALLRIRAEERTLRARLGAAWDEYASGRWCLLPGVF